jgi:putative ABC transport system permease protein
MSFWKIAWRNIWQRALASSLTGLSMALGVAAMIAVIVIHSVAVRQFSQDAQGYHLIVGGKGGKLQLVMSTVYHLGDTLYPIPYTYYQRFLEGGDFADSTEVAIPICLGDSYEAPNGALFRVVGTTPDLFDKLHYGNFDDGTPKVYEFAQGGRNFEAEHFYEAVVGSIVARRAGLKLGDEINPTHGISGQGHKHDGFKVVGILKPTGTANDRAVFINIEGFYLLEGHADTSKATPPAADTEELEHVHETGTAHADDPGDEHAHADDMKADGDADHKQDADHDLDAEGHVDAHADAAEEHAEHAHKEGPTQADMHAHEDDHAHQHDHEPLPIEQRKVTSILVLCKNFGELALDNAINKADDGIAQAVAPAREVSLLLDRIVGPLQFVLLVLTFLIVIVAGISILVSIYNSMSERSHDIAVMRALGASRGAVMSIVLVESILLSLGGGLFGILLGHGMIGLASSYVIDATGVSLNAFQFDWQELVLIPGLIMLASLVGFLPALAAYRTDVAKSLAKGR